MDLPGTRYEEDDNCYYRDRFCDRSRAYRNVFYKKQYNKAGR